MPGDQVIGPKGVRLDLSGCTVKYPSKFKDPKTGSAKAKIPLKEAVAWIASIQYPDDNPTDAKKRVRERIRYAAEEKGEVEVKAEMLISKNFFSWAINKWPKLAHIEGLPRIVGIEAPSKRLKLSGKRPMRLVMPRDRAAFEKAYSKCESERQRLEVEVSALEGRVAKLEKEVHRWREADKKMRQKRSVAGKDGGRGNVALDWD